MDNILDLVDAIKEELKKKPALARVNIKDFAEETPIPEQCPFINIVPRAKPREREFIIGAGKLYHETNEVTLDIYHCSGSNLRQACNKAETVARDVLIAIEETASSVFGVDTHESHIESYDFDVYNGYFFYKVEIVVSARDDRQYN